MGINLGPFNLRQKYLVRYCHANLLVDGWKSKKKRKEQEEVATHQLRWKYAIYSSLFHGEKSYFTTSIALLSYKVICNDHHSSVLCSPLLYRPAVVPLNSQTISTDHIETQGHS